MTSPRGQAWNPPRDFVAESFVLRTKACPEGRLFVNQYKRVKQQPDKPTVFKQRDISENQALTENRDHHRDVHWISDIPKESSFDPPTGDPPCRQTGYEPVGDDQ